MIKLLLFSLYIFINSLNLTHANCVFSNYPFVNLIVTKVSKPSAKVIITSFAPAVITAGTTSILTIKGKSFGIFRGSGGVFFKNADNGGIDYIMYADSEDYLSWSDTEIKMKVPSIILSDPEQGTPGSGVFIVRDQYGNSVVSITPLTISYALNAQAFVTTVIKKEILLPSTNSPAGILKIKIDQEIAKNVKALAAIEKAIKDWRCNTGANIIIDKDPAGNMLYAPDNASYDKVCSIIFSGKMPETTLARTIQYRKECDDKSKILLVSKEFDILINKNFIWDYDTSSNAIPGLRKDFYGVVLHELGHALGLSHVNNKSDLMYFEVTNFPRKTLSSINSKSSIEGVLYMQKLMPNDLSACDHTFKIGVSASCNISENYVKDFLLHPNPVYSSNLNLVWNSEEKEEVIISIYDAQGKEIFNEEFFFINKGAKKAEIDANRFSKGIYFMKIFINKKSYTKRFLKA